MLDALVSELLRFVKSCNTLVELEIWERTVRPRGFGQRVQLREDTMSKQFTYRQGLLPVPAGVAMQRVVVTVDGVAGDPVTLPATQESFEFSAGPEGVTVELRLDYLDAAGNDSADFSTSFVVADQIPPDAPTGFGELTQISEQDV